MEKHDKKIEKSNQSEIITVKLYTEDDIFLKTRGSGNFHRYMQCAGD